jgi:SP family myo-inositol transporter-like MFS transporter 13
MRILKRIYSSEDVEKEMKLLQSSVEAEQNIEADIGGNIISKCRNAMKDVVVRRALYAGITVQVVQQFVGINTVMYYSPTIMQLAGFASKVVALGLSLVTSGLNCVGSVIAMCFVDRFGRRKMMLVSLVAIIIGLIALSMVFLSSSRQAPRIDDFDSNHLVLNGTCSAYISAPKPSSWNCMTCLKHDCGYCASAGNQVSWFNLYSNTN